MRLICLIIGLLCAFSSTFSQYTYIFEVQDENRGPTSELFGDLSQFKFVPPSQLAQNPSSVSSAPNQPLRRDDHSIRREDQSIRRQDQSIRRQDEYDTQPARRMASRSLSQAEQNQRQFVVRAPQQDQRQALLRQQLQQAFSQPQPQPQQAPNHPQPQPQSSLLNRFQSQPQNALALSQPRPQTFPQLQPHQTAHLTPVLRTIAPRNEPIPSAASDFNSGLLTSFVNSQSRPTNARPNTALQTLGQSQRFSRQQPQPQPQSFAQPLPQIQSNSNSIQSEPPILRVSNRESLTEADIIAIQEHNKKVQEFLRQREQDNANQNQRSVQNQVLQNQRAAQDRAAQERAAQDRAAQERAAQDRAAQDRAAQERAAQDRAQRAAQERAAQERALRERALQERALQERAAQERAAQERAAQERAAQDRAAQQERALQRQRAEQPRSQPQYIPQEDPIPVHSYNNVRVPDTTRRRVAPTPAPVPSYNIPRTTAAPQDTARSQDFKPSNLGLAALPPDSDSDGIPGEAGRDYPTLETIPKTSFSCARQPLSGYYGDTETACQVVHLCQFGGVQDSFLCPNGTIWNQEKFSCQWWYEVQCANSPRFYALNDKLYKTPEKEDKLNNNNNKK